MVEVNKDNSRHVKEDWGKTWRPQRYAKNCRQLRKREREKETDFSKAEQSTSIDCPTPNG